MTKPKKPHQSNPTETLQNLVNDKQERTQQTPAWPGAKEQAEPQHAHPQPSSDETAPSDTEKTPPSQSGYERSDIGKRHH